MMNELLEWLRHQKGGLNTYIEFQQKALALLSSDPGHAALARLLSELAGRFVDAYNGEPLPASVADQALARLTGLVEKASRSRTADAASQIVLLNEVGLAELTQADKPRLAGKT